MMRDIGLLPIPARGTADKPKVNEDQAMSTKRREGKTSKRPVKRTAKKPAAKKRVETNGQVPVAVVDSAPPSPLRGILPTPPEVEALVARELEGHPVTDREKQRITDCFKMQFYFGGHWIAYRQTDKGMEVLAVGMDDIGRLRRKRTPASEKDRIILRYCDPW
jgi:hypothetical protein